MNTIKADEVHNEVDFAHTALMERLDSVLVDFDHTEFLVEGMMIRLVM